MKAPSPAFSLYPKDIASDERCQLMDLDEFGAYMRLLCHAWIEGSIPSDPTRLARLLGVGGAKFAAVWPAVAPCWEASEVEPGRLIQSRQERQRAEQLARSALQAERGARGGKSRVSNKTPKPALASSLSREQAGSKPALSLPSPSPSPSNGNSSERATRALRLADRSPAAVEAEEPKRAECKALLAEIVAAEDADPVEVIRDASRFTPKGGGGERFAVSVDTLQGEYLERTRLALRDRAARLRKAAPPVERRADPRVVALWGRVLNRLRADVPPQSWSLWLKSTSAVEATDRLTVLVPSAGHVRWCSENYGAAVVAACAAEGHPVVAVDWVDDADALEALLMHREGA